MARTATGTIIPHPGRDGRTNRSLRFTAYGKTPLRIPRAGQRQCGRARAAPRDGGCRAWHVEASERGRGAARGRAGPDIPRVRRSVGPTAPGAARQEHARGLRMATQTPLPRVRRASTRRDQLRHRRALHRGGAGRGQARTAFDQHDGQPARPNPGDRSRAGADRQEPREGQRTAREATGTAAGLPGECRAEKRSWTRPARSTARRHPTNSTSPSGP